MDRRPGFFAARRSVERRGRSLCRPVSAAALIAVLAAPAPAAAQFALEEIIVTAQKREERLQTVPVAVSAFAADGLQSRSITQLQDLQWFVPNIEMNGGRADGAGTTLALFIRGVGQQDFLFPNDPGVGLYIDGVYMARAVGANLDMTDVERIEVLRGPQGTLYGKNTIGGAINVHTWLPDLNEINGSIEGTTGRYNRADVRGHVSVPLVADTLALKVSGVVRNRDGFMTRPTDGKDLGDVDSQGLSAAMRWRAGQRVEFVVRGDYSRKRENGPAGNVINIFPSENLVPVPIPDPTPSTPLDLTDLYNFIVAPNINESRGLPADSRYDGRWVTGSQSSSWGSGNVRSDGDIWGLSLTGSVELTDSVTVKSITAFRRTVAEFARDGDHTPYRIVETNNDLSQNQFSQEFQLAVDTMDGRLQWIIGAFHMHEKARDENLVFLLDPIVQFTGGPTPENFMLNLNLHPFMRVKTDTWAVFSQAAYNVTDRLRITLGGRYSRDKKEAFQTFQFMEGEFLDPFGNITPCYTCLEDGVTGRTLDKSWGAFTPQVGIDYMTNDDTMVYASYSRGFKSGGWSPRPTPANPSDLAFDPEFIDSFEIGAKTQRFDRRLTLNVAAFLNEYKDIQLTTLQPNFALEVTNAGKNRLHGVEAELVARLVDNLDVNFSVGHLKNKFRELASVDPNFAVDNKLPEAPEWTVNMGVQYAVPLANMGALVLRGDASYRSKTWKDPYNLDRSAIWQVGAPQPIETVIPSGTDGYLVSMPELAQSGYGLVNARVSYHDPGDRWEVAVFVTNLTDETYVTSLLPVSAFGYDEAYYGRPREWGASVSYRF